MERGIIYCRVSSKEQIENYSLANQQTACEKYCSQNDIEIARVFIEKGESAKTTNRPQFMEMLSYCEKNKGKLSFIVVYHSSRFSRDANDHLTIRTKLAGLGIKLRSCTENLSEDPQGKFIETLFAGINQLDNDIKSQRTLEGMKAAVNEGRWIHNPPLGYVKGKKGEASLKFDDEKAPLVRKAFELFETGRYTKQELRKKLNAMGLRSRRGNPLSPQSMENLLRNEAYIGIIHEKKWRVKKRGDFEPLIDEDLFRHVQAVLQGKRKLWDKRLKQHPDFPLRYFLRCSECGNPLTGSWSKGKRNRYAYYRCPNSKCLAVKFRKEDLDAIFLEILHDLKPEAQFAELFKAILKDAFKSTQADSEESKQRLKRRIAELKAKQERLEERFIYEANISEDTYRKHEKRLQDDIEAAYSALAMCEMQLIDAEPLIDFGMNVLSELVTLWQGLDIKEKQVLQETIFPEGLICSKDSIEGFDGSKQAIGTPKINPVFSVLAENRVSISNMG